MNALITADPLVREAALWAPPMPLWPDRWIVSPTQADKFHQCQRKWAWEYIDGAKPPQKASAQVGDRVHQILEGWLQYSHPPNTEERLVIVDPDKGELTYLPGRIAYSGLHLQPMPSPHLDVEVKFSVDDLWGGRLDLAYAEADGHPVKWEPAPPLSRAPAYVRRHLHVIQDHKTSTDPMKWGKSADDLRKDVQAIVYADAGLRACGDSELELRWLYHQTREPYKPRQTVLRIGRGEVDDAIGPWTELAKEIVALKLGGKYRTALEFEPNPNACQMFGGCAFINRCNLRPEQLMRGFFMQEQSLTEKVMAMKANKAAGLNGATLPIAPVALPSESPITDWRLNENDPTGQWEWSPSTGQQRQRALPPLPPAPVPETVSTSTSAAAVATAAGILGAVRTMPHTVEHLELIRQRFLDGKSPKEIADEFSWIETIIHDTVAQRGGTWIVEARAGKVNPPEEPKTPKIELGGAGLSPEPDEDDESKGNDEFDAMDRDALKVFVAQHGLNVDLGRYQAKKCRVLVRAAWKHYQIALGKGLSHADAQVPTPTPAAAKTPAPPVPVGGQLAILTQAMVATPPPLPVQIAPQPPALPIAPTPPPLPVQAIAQPVAAPSAPPPLPTAAPTPPPLPTVAQAPALPQAPPIPTTPPALPAGFEHIPNGPSDRHGLVPSPATGTGAFRLFVDCTPRRTDAVVMGVREAFAPAFEEAARGEGANGLDYRLVAFGKGPGILAAAVSHLQKTRPLGEGTIVCVSSASAESQALLETLTALAGEVVVGG